MTIIAEHFMTQIIGPDKNLIKRYSLQFIFIMFQLMSQPLPLPVLSTLAQRELLPMLPMLLQLLPLPQLPMLLTLLSPQSQLLLQLTMALLPTPMEPLSPLTNQLLLRLELLTSMLWLMPDTKFQSCQQNLPKTKTHHQ